MEEGRAAGTSPDLTVAPNPMADRAEVSYHLTQPGRVSCVVYDAAGNRRAVLANGTQPAGAHRLSWRTSVPAGAYLCRLETPAGTRTARLVKTR